MLKTDIFASMNLSFIASLTALTIKLVDNFDYQTHALDFLYVSNALFKIAMFFNHLVKQNFSGNISFLIACFPCITNMKIFTKKMFKKFEIPSLNSICKFMLMQSGIHHEQNPSHMI